MQPVGRRPPRRDAARRSPAGPVYQGVCKQIRALIRSKTIDKTADAGTIAQARSVAASIDRVSGHDDPRAQASGMQLAALHAQLFELIGRLTGETTDDDAFDQLLRELNDGTGSATAPHTPPA